MSACQASILMRHDSLDLCSILLWNNSGDERENPSLVVKAGPSPVQTMTKGKIYQDTVLSIYYVHLAATTIYNTTCSSNNNNNLTVIFF